MSSGLIFVNPKDFSDTLSQINRQLRSSLENPQTPLSFPAEWAVDMFTGGRTDAGVRVTEYTALQVATVYSCVDLISSTVGALPLNVFEIQMGQSGHPSHRLAIDHALFDLLRFEPNPEMTAATFRKTLQVHGLLWGNQYAEIVRDGANRILGVYPRNPARTRPYRTSKGLLVYKTSEGFREQTDPNDVVNPEGPERTIFSEDMLHIPGLSLDGRLGQGTIWLARQVVGLALATEKHGAKLFSNGARPGGILLYPGKLKPEARLKLKQSWDEAQSGENIHKTALLEENLKWQETASKNNEAQFLETRQFQKAEICSIFHVPPHMIGDTEKSNRANTEQLGLEFVTFTLRPWLEAWQQEIRRKLFPRVGRTANKFAASFDTRDITMPDAESRKDFYNSGKQWGWLSTNLIHTMEKLNPVEEEWADQYWMPINMSVAGQPLPAPDGGNQGGADELGKRFIRAYSALFSDCMGRFSSRNDRTFDAIRTTFLPIILTIGEQLWDIAAEQFNVEGGSELESSRFVVDYLGAMELRLRDQTPDGLRAVADRELRRVVRALAVEIFRTVGTRRAKAQLEA